MLVFSTVVLQRKEPEERGDRYGGRVVKLRNHKDVLLVVVLLAITYAYFFHDTGWNENSRFGLVFAVVQEGRFTIDSFHDRIGTATGDKSFFNGHYYSDKAIGTSALGALVYFPLYWLTKTIGYAISLWWIKYLLTWLVVGLPSALLGGLMYVAGTWITASRVRAYTATMAIALGTMCFPYSLVFFGHQLAATLLFGGFFMIFQLRIKPSLYRWWYLCVLGLVLGFALITEYTTAIIVFPLILYYMYVLWKEPSIRADMTMVTPAVGGLIPVSLLLVYNTLCFGSPLSLGYAHLESQFFRNSMAQGLMGIHLPQPMVLYYITMHPAHGLFWQSPVLLMALLGVYRMLCTRHYRAEAALTITAFVSYLLLNSGYYMWWGGWAFGPRHLIPMLPFLCLPLLFVPKRGFPVLAVLSLVSAAQMLIVAASAVEVPDTMIRNIRTLGYFEYSSIYSYCLRQLLNGQFAWNLGQQLFGWTQVRSLLPLVFALVCGSMLVVKMNQNHAGVSSFKR